MNKINQTPVTIIGGYLGSGKTTLVNHLLRNASGLRLAILVNEFGALAIDQDLIEAQDDEIISLSGGCVCCSYGNDLMMAMMDMARMSPRPDHIILEASGVALPGAIASSLSLLNDYSVDGTVVLSDAETIRLRAKDKYMGDTVLRQLADADIVLLNKTDLVSEQDRQTTRDWLEATASDAAVVETEHCAVSPQVLFRDFEHKAKPQPATTSHGAHPFSTKVVVPDAPVDPGHFGDQLIKECPGLVRAKGFLKSNDGAMVTLQIVGRRVEISPAPEGVEPGVVTIQVKDPTDKS